MVVIDFNAEDNDWAYQSDDIGDPKRPNVCQNSEYYEEGRPESHHDEGRHGDTVGVASAYGGVSLWHITQNHAYGRCIRYYVYR